MSPGPHSGLATMTIHHPRVSPTAYIDRIEWLVDGVPRASYEKNITRGTSTTLTIAHAPGFARVTEDFDIRIYLAGDTLSTPAIARIEGTVIPKP